WTGAFESACRRRLPPHRAARIHVVDYRQPGPSATAGRVRAEDRGAGRDHPDIAPHLSSIGGCVVPGGAAPAGAVPIGAAPAGAIPGRTAPTCPVPLGAAPASAIEVGVAPTGTIPE